MIKDIINKHIIFSSINSSIKDISKLMNEYNIGFIPIVDNDKYIGVVTDRDIALILPLINNVNNSIKSYVKNNIILIDYNSSIDDALELMGKYKVKRLLVSDKDKIIGVISLSDILNYSKNDNILNTYKEIFYIKDNKKNIDAEIDSFYL